MTAGRTEPNHPSGIVADGAERERKAWHDRIRKRVEGKYGPQLARSGFLRRLLLRRRIAREIRSELNKVAPSDANYFDVSDKE